MKKKKKITTEEKLSQYFTEHKVYCENPICSGHGVVFMDRKIDRKLCVNCGHWIYRDKKTKLKYEMKERGIKING